MAYTFAKQLLLGALVLGLGTSDFARAEVQTDNINESWVREPDYHPYNQVFSLQTGFFEPFGLSLSNSGYKYDYIGNSLKSYVVEAGGSIKMFHLLGAVYLQESLGFSSFKSALPGTSDNLSLYMISSDTRIHHAWEWFPIKVIIPFIEAGYRYSVFTQSGPSDFEFAQGSVGNIVAAFGLDLWINELFSNKKYDSVSKFNSIPIFLSAKVNRIFPTNSDLNLGSTNLLMGLSIGI